MQNNSEGASIGLPVHLAEIIVEEVTIRVCGTWPRSTRYLLNTCKSLELEIYGQRKTASDSVHRSNMYTCIDCRKNKLQNKIMQEYGGCSELVAMMRTSQSFSEFSEEI